MYQVLIVDDEPIVKIALQSMLNWEELGFHICTTASNEKEALEAAERFEPDLIICDLKMPVLDGIGLIHTAKEKGMDCEFLVISNYEDFNFVRTALVLGAFDYILKVSISPEDLTEQLKKIRSKLDGRQSVKTNSFKTASISRQQKHGAWRDFFIHPSYTSKELFQTTGLSFQPADCTDTLSICQISFDWYIQRSELPSSDLIRSTLKNALEQIQSRIIIFLDDTNILLLVPDSQLNLHQNTISGLCARISQLFGYYMSLAPSILYQSGLASLEDARRAYHDFQPILKLNFYGPLGIVNAVSVKAAVPPAIPYKKLSSQIQEYTGEDQIHFAFQEITTFLNQCRNRQISPEDAIQYCIRLLDNLEYHIPGGTSPIHEQLADLADSMRKAQRIEDLLRDIAAALPLIFSPKTQEDVKNSGFSLEVSQAISYIEKHYDSKISLASIADYVGLSSSYLCRVFKEETGLNINTYINNLRMSKAVVLLGNKNSYIKEVAVSVGFDDQLYFSRLFKKYYGVTPSQYRAAEK